MCKYINVTVNIPWEMYLHELTTISTSFPMMRLTGHRIPSNTAWKVTLALGEKRILLNASPPPGCEAERIMLRTRESSNPSAEAYTALSILRIVFSFLRRLKYREPSSNANLGAGNTPPHPNISRPLWEKAQNGVGLNSDTEEMRSGR